VYKKNRKFVSDEEGHGRLAPVEYRRPTPLHPHAWANGTFKVKLRKKCCDSLCCKVYSWVLSVRFIMLCLFVSVYDMEDVS